MMNKLKAAFAELAGMFVDDWHFAALILTLVLSIAFVFRVFQAAPYLLLGGLAALLLGFTWSEARK